MTGLAESSLWLNEPERFKAAKTDMDEIPEECMSEAKQSRVHNLLVTSSSRLIEREMPCENFSSLKKLLLVTAYVLKFIGIVKKICRTHPIRTSYPTISRRHIECGFRRFRKLYHPLTNSISEVNS